MHRILRPLIWLLVLAGSTIALSACGGVDQDAYVQQVSQVQARTVEASQRVSSAMEKAKTPKEIGSHLEELGLAVRRSAAELRRLEVPSDVKTQHAEYAKLLDGYGNSLRGFAARVSGATLDNANAIIDEAVPLTKDFSEREAALITEINAALQG